MKAVLISIQPKWVEKIANGEKTIEVRKTTPKLERPFKVYIYATWNGNKKEILVKQDGRLFCEDWRKASGLQRESGKVIGEFVCRGMMDGSAYLLPKQSCLTRDEIFDYAKGKRVYGWRIADLKIYDKPKELGEFRKPCPYMDGTHCLEHKCEYYDDYSGKCCCKVERPPQSWCYVEELQNE